MLGSLPATGILQNLRPLLNPPNGETPKTGLLVKEDVVGSPDPDNHTQESSSALSSIQISSDINDDSGVLANMAAGDMTAEVKDNTEENDLEKQGQKDEQGFMHLLSSVVYKYLFV